MKKVLILLILSALSVGCKTIRERHPGLDARGRCTLRFRYTFNAENADKFVSLVHAVRLYAFDEATGRLAWVGPIDDAQLADAEHVVEIPTGTYTLVAWGVSTPSFEAGGFREAEAVDPAAHLYTTPVSTETTTSNNFRMMLDVVDARADAGAEAEPRVADFADLFYASAAGVRIDPGAQATVDFDFVRNTNVLSVSVLGVGNLTRSARAETRAETRAPSDLDVFVLARNGIYDRENTVAEGARSLRYSMSSDSNVDGADLKARFKTLRMYQTRAETDQMHLYIQRNGVDLVQPLNITQALLAAHDQAGNPIWDGQEALDRNYEFPIALSVQPDLSVVITAGDYQVVILNPIIDKNTINQ